MQPLLTIWNARTIVRLDMASQPIKSALHEAALAWAEAGFAVFPCAPSEKRPATSRGLNEATTDPTQIDAWWNDNPRFNIGVAPARSAMFVLDVDPPLGADTLKALEQQHGMLPSTLTIRTPRGGLHYWFQGEQRSTVQALGPKLDTRGIGGYVLVPPSIVNGVEYTYASDTNDIADGPQWIADAIHSAREEVSAAEGIELDTERNIGRARLLVQQYAERGDVAVEGSGGDNRTYQVACEVLNLGLSPAKAWEVIRDDWNPHCIPPWDEEELAVKIRNAAEYSQNDAGAWAETSAAEAFGSVVLDPKLIEAAKSNGLDKPSRFAPHALNEVEAFKEPEWIIPGLIPKNGTVQIQGAQKSFKTYLTLDLCLGIASGTETFGQTPKAAPVVYAVGENAAAVALRHVPAWKAAREFTDEMPFYIVGAVPRAADPAEPIEFIEEVRKRHIKPAVVVIDTATRALRGLDENSAKDMGQFSAACEFIQTQLDCTVIVIRHTGKDKERGGRGSNVIEGDFDTILQVDRHDKTMFVALSVKEQRNAAEREEPYRFEGRPWENSLAFFPVGDNAWNKATKKDNPFANQRIGAALRELGAIGADHTVTTLVLATHITPQLNGETQEERERAVAKNARELVKASRGHLEGYAVGEGKNLRWFLEPVD